MIITGLISDFVGVITLTVLTDRSLDNLIDKMNKFVDESWEDSVKKWKKKKRAFTVYGISWLLLGLGLQLWANWITLWH